MDLSMGDRPWPVSWEPAVALAHSRGEHPDALLRDHRLAAHRVLDRMAAAAAEVHDEALGARQAMRALLIETLTALPWLTPTREDPAHSTENNCAPCGSESLASGAARSYTAPATLINDDGVSGLTALARALVGSDAATAIRRLAAAARAAEGRIPNLFPGAQADSSADLALLAGAPVHPHETRSDPTLAEAHTLNGTFWTNLVRTVSLTTVSPCQATLDRLSLDDLDEYPPPTGTATNTTGIARVDIPDPCGPAPLMTIHGQGFGAQRPSNINVIVATWDTHASQLVYQIAQNVSWADDTIVAHLTSTVVPGYAAFADLNFVKEYNDWADARNTRLTNKMHANGCPGRWTVEVHLALSPDPNPAAAYHAGAPVLIGQLSPTVGSAQMWDADTVHLHAGDTFRIAWRVYGADTFALRPADGVSGGAAEILTAAGYPASGAVLTPQDGYLTFTAPATPVRASFVLAADNGCGTAWVEMAIVVTIPPLAPATVTVFQALAVDADVTVTPGTGGEVLNPATGNTIPLVAGKRTVVRIDWWLGTEQPPSTDLLLAQASVTVSGDMLPHGGVTLQPFLSTADSAPPADPIVQASGPGFTSLAQYQQWVAGGGRTNPFYVVLPPDLCLGGTILGTPRQALTVIDATITVTVNGGTESWTLNAGIEVTFHPRRAVTLRYVPFALSASVLPPDDGQCAAALQTAGALLPVPDPDVVRLPGPFLVDDGHLVEDLVAQRTALQGAQSDSWRDEIWIVMGTPDEGGVSMGEYVIAASTDALVCVHEIGHEYHQNHLNVCGNVPQSDPMSTWPDNGYVPIEGWDEWDNADVAPGRLEVMAYRYCAGAGWIHPERWRRIFLQAGPPA